MIDFSQIKKVILLVKIRKIQTKIPIIYAIKSQITFQKGA